MFTKHYKLILTAIIIFMATVSFKLAWDDSLTFDEVAHIPSGYSYVKFHDYRLNPEHPPLLKTLSGLAMLPLHPNFDTAKDFWTTLNNYGEYDQWAAGRYFLHRAGNDTDKLMFFARTPIIITSLLFALLMFYWGKRLGGITAGLFATILYASDPNILGHNHFVTTDIGIALAISLSIFYFLQFLKKPTWANALKGGLALGIAEVTKFSAILLFPFFGLLLFVYPLLKYYKEDESRLRSFFLYISKGVFAVLVSFAVIWIVYLPVTYEMPGDVLPEMAHIKGNPSKHPRDAYLIKFIEKTNQNTLTRPIAVYTQGLMQVFNRVDDGNVTYFMGRVSSEASPWYFPFVFVAKQSLVHLFFYTVAITIFFVALARSLFLLFTQKFTVSLRKFRDFVLARFSEISLGLFVVLYSYLSITGNLNIGFRHLFPIMPLIYILTSKTIIDSYKQLRNPLRKRAVRLVFIILIFAMIGETLLAYPYYMSYFNPVFGGPKNGWHYVTDSNADWGQDLKRLKIYLDKHPEIDKIRIDYFGGDDILNRIGEGKYELWWESKRPIEPGYYAICTFFLQESLHKPGHTYDSSYEWTKKYTPIDQVGTSFLIYKIEE